MEQTKVPPKKTLSQSLKAKNPLLILPILSVILLPLIIGGIFVAQNLRSEAQVCTPALDISANRISNIAAEITFRTATNVRANIQCAIQRNGTQISVGEDSEATTQHNINTQDDGGTNLNPNTGYYCYIYTCADSPTEFYIPASATSRTYGLDFSGYSDVVYGACSGDVEFDPALDVNGDGCILLNDLNEFPDFDAGE